MDELIKKATKPTKATVEGVRLTQSQVETVSESLLKPIKTKCKSNDLYIADAARYLILDVSHRNWIVRLRTLNVIDALFLRSSRFRALICKDIRLVAESGGLIDTSALKISSAQLNSISATTGMPRVTCRVKELLEVWDIQYGTFFPVLRATARYLREGLQLKMPNLTLRAQKRAEKQLDQEQQTQRLVMAHGKSTVNEARQGLKDIESDLEKMDRLFSILFPSLEDFAPSSSSSYVAPIPIPLSATVYVSSTTSSSGKGRQLEIRYNHQNKRRREMISSANDDDSDVSEGECEDEGEEDAEEEKGGNLKKVTGAQGGKDEDEDDDDDDDEEGLVWEDGDVQGVDAFRDDGPVEVMGDEEEQVEQADGETLMIGEGLQLSVDAAKSANAVRTSDNTELLDQILDHARQLAKFVPKAKRWTSSLLRAREGSAHSPADRDQSVEDMMRRIALVSAALYKELARSGKFFEVDLLN